METLIIKSGDHGSERTIEKYADTEQRENGRRNKEYTNTERRSKRIRKKVQRRKDKKNSGLTRKVNALETENEDLKQDINNATEFFIELDGMNDDLKKTNERLSAQIEKDMGYIDNVYGINSNLYAEINNAEELFKVVDEMNDELKIENEYLQEFMDYHESLGTYSEGEIENAT